MQFMLQIDSVSRQETVEKIADLSARKATVDSNASNVHRLEDLQSFQKVYAPFDGVLTARNTDVGALIDAGANSAGKELFHLAAIDTFGASGSPPLGRIPLSASYFAANTPAAVFSCPATKAPVAAFSMR